jgi:hypothetical protein
LYHFLRRLEHTALEDIVHYVVLIQHEKIIDAHRELKYFDVHPKPLHASPIVAILWYSREAREFVTIHRLFEGISTDEAVGVEDSLDGECTEGDGSERHGDVKACLHHCCCYLCEDT